MTLPFKVLESMINAEVSTPGVMAKASNTVQLVTEKQPNLLAGIGRSILSGIDEATSFFSNAGVGESTGNVGFEQMNLEPSLASSRYFGMDIPETLTDGDPETSGIARMVIMKNEGGQLWPSDGTPFMNFIMTSMQDQTSERVQVSKVDENLNLYFFGSNPRSFSISGILKKNNGDRWDLKQARIWENLMRGTKLALMKCHLEITIQGRIFSGYGVGFNLQSSSQVDGYATFSMQFILSKPPIHYDFWDTSNCDAVANDRKEELLNQQAGAKAGGLPTDFSMIPATPALPIDTLASSASLSDPSNMTVGLWQNPISLGSQFVGPNQSGYSSMPVTIFTPAVLSNGTAGATFGPYITNTTPNHGEIK